MTRMMDSEDRSVIENAVCGKDAGVPLIDHPDDAVTRSHLDPRMFPAGVPATRLAPGKLK